MSWFYCPKLDDALNQVCLEGEEARHIRSVRRMSEGQEITLFDGGGTIVTGTIESLSSRSVSVRVSRRCIAEPAKPRRILATALPKGERLGTLLDMATQLGMTDFIPLNCERSVVKPVSGKQMRMQRICISACKQSRCGYLPRIHEPAVPAQLQNILDLDGAVFLLADPHGVPLDQVARHIYCCDSLVMITGPEGGFTESERNRLIESGALSVRISDAILRVETAAIALLAQSVIVLSPQSGPLL